ncbi:ATP-binding protein [Quadrisphaera sp. DSM 44207]|uniref:ATP-binding protein n=1 Tax=Quadrisphaera sp. DSM 44207 TaxID=1881057 RepID=UPI00087FDB74|nr:ATP-binding protein [Quadrisphaera sp. DSM 44207]SDQ34783.1 ATPase family associated with various cellular activities (AAA) [Quadrisphaera sp. DSM 44207]
MTSLPRSGASPLTGEAPAVRRALTLLGELLTGASGTTTTASGFLEACLHQPHTSLVVEQVELTNTRAVSVGAALADLVAVHGAALGPVRDDEAPTWGRIDLGDEHLSVPTSAAAFFPAGTAAGADVVVQLLEHDFEPEPASLRVLTRPADHAAAREVADALLATARRDKGFFRGRVLHASARLPLELEPTTLAEGSREDLVLPEAVWAEVDVNVAALTSRAPVMRDLGLGTNRGILLAGPPGVGKSALSRVVARELAGAFTVIIVDAAAATTVLRQVYRETADLGPCVVVLEDVDLYLGDRRAGARGTALADLLAVLDGTEPYTDVLTIASTNDPAALDAAVTRSARFDAVVHLAPPDRAACARILHRYLGGASGPTAGVDVTAVAAVLPAGITGADLREVVRRAVLAHGRELTTERLQRVVAEGRWQPGPLTGSYL